MSRHPKNACLPACHLKLRSTSRIESTFQSSRIFLGSRIREREQTRASEEPVKPGRAALLSPKQAKNRTAVGGEAFGA